MDPDTLIVAVIALAALASVLFTVVPLVPGTIFVPLAAIVCGFVVGWDELGWWFWVAQAVLVVGYLLIDNVAQVFGVRRLGGSRAAMVGGAIGVFVGPLVLGLLLGPLALFVGPPIGAVVGTLVGEARARRRGAGSPLEAPITIEPSVSRPGATPSPTPGAASSPGSVSPAGYARLGLGALVAFIVGTTCKLVVVTVQIALLVWVV